MRTSDILRFLRSSSAAAKAQREREHTMREAGVERHALFDDTGCFVGHQFVMVDGGKPRLPSGWTRRPAPPGSVPVP